MTTNRILRKRGCSGEFALLVAACFALSVLSAVSQSNATRTGATQQAVNTDSAPLAFEVVSIRPVDPDSKEKSYFGPTPDGFRATNVPLVTLFRFGYVPTEMGGEGFFRVDRMEGVPNWLTTDRYDIVAKVDESDLARWQRPAEQTEMLRTMVRSLLGERCHVQVHRGSREAAVYDLTVTKSGPKLKLAESTDPREIGRLHPGANTIAGGATMVKGCSPSEVDFYNCSMKSLAMILATPTARPVVDETGLTGRYDFALTYMPVQTITARDEAPGENDAPSVFTAVEEQLGLKLDAAKAQVETLVIDHVERPTEN